MALKEKKKIKQFPCNKEANSRANWPDLPQQLINIIARKSTLMQNTSFGGVSKSWRAASKQCNPNATPPWLQLSDVNNNQPHIFTISFRQGEYIYRSQRYPPGHWHPWKCYVGYSHGELVAKGATPSDYYLWDPLMSGGVRQLPPWNASVPFKYAVLSSPIPDWPSNKICTLMVLTGISHPAFMFCRVTEERTPAFWFCRATGARERAWIKQDCTIVDPHCSDRSDRHHYMQFTNAIGFDGKFYALSLQGTLAVIEVIDSHPRVIALGTRRAVPSVFSKHFREYLVESDGEILLIFLISRKLINVVDDVEVFRLDLAKLSWIKMDCHGDRTLFVGVKCCMSVSASKVGCRSNCVYFTNHTFDGWWVYDMETHSLSPGWTDANSTTKSPVWTEPILEE